MLVFGKIFAYVLSGYPGVVLKIIILEKFGKF